MYGFFISVSFSLVRFAKTDHAESLATLTPSENAQAIVDRGHCDKPGLRIVHASIFNGEGSIPIDPGDIREIKAAFGKSLVSLLVIPFKLHGDLYTHIKWRSSINVCTKMRQARAANRCKSFLRAASGPVRISTLGWRPVAYDEADEGLFRRYFKATLQLLRCESLGMNACSKGDRCDVLTPRFIADSAIFLFARIVSHRETSLSKLARYPRRLGQLAQRRFGAQPASAP